MLNIAGGCTSLVGSIFDSIGGMWSPYCCHNESRTFPDKIQGFHQQSEVVPLADSMQEYRESISLIFKAGFKDLFLIFTEGMKL